MRKEQEAARQKTAAARLATKPIAKKPVATKKATGITISKKPAATETSLNSNECAEKERLVTSMGFSSDMAKAALQKYDWDPQRAINFLLSNPGTSSMTMAPPKTNTMAPPPGLSKPQIQSTAHEVGLKGTRTMAPPPGIKVSSVQSEKPQKIKMNEPLKVTEQGRRQFLESLD